MERVLVIGQCGAGKSTLAPELGRVLGLPVTHIDQLNWNAGWIESGKAVLAERLTEVVAGERWLIDGNYSGTLPLRLARADPGGWLDYPGWLCVWRLMRRWARWRGRSRPDMAVGCPERFDPAFLWYVLTWRSGPGVRTREKLAGFGGRVVRLGSPAQTARWMAGLASGKLTNAAVTNRR